MGRLPRAAPDAYVRLGVDQIGIGGDFIMAIDGKPVDRQDALSLVLARKRAGDNLDLLVYRGRGEPAVLPGAGLPIR